MPNYKTTAISGPQFKGLSQNLALTAGDPRYALDCINVIPSVAGLAKLRVPTTVSASTVGGNGPDQFGMWEGATQKGLLAFFGQDFYIYSLDDFTPALLDSQPSYAGPVPWSVVQSNNIAFLQNGSTQPLKYTGIPIIPGDASSAIQFWGIQKAQTPTLGTVSGGTLNLTTGRKYRVAYKNGNTLAVGTASDASASTGALVNKKQPVTIPAPGSADGQITAARLYATLDGGSDYFFHSEIVSTFPATINDETADTALDQSERAPLINDQPPVAKYLCLWGGRIFMFNLPNQNTRFVAYTGYNRIFVGRPEETCPPGNRIKLDTGADEIAGGGVIAAGVVVFDRSNKMFMFRGQPEDITVTAPVEFTLVLRQLPWDIGCASHYTIASTKRGLIWLSPCLDIYLFDGSSEPQALTDGVEPIMRTINMAQIGNSRGVYWQYRGRDWYVLAFATGTESQLNKILIVDLEENQEQNFGIVPLDVGTFQSIGIVEMNDGTQRLIIGQNGALKELTVTATTRSGVEETVTQTASTLGAYWQSGYFGTDEITREKFFRWGRVTADQSGIRVKRRIIRDDVTNPAVLEFVDTPTGGKFETNKKGRLLSYELRFRDEDVPQNILSMTDVHIPLSVR